MPKTPSLLAQFKFLRRPGELVATGQTAIDGQSKTRARSTAPLGRLYVQQPGAHIHTRADVQENGQVISEGL